MTVDDETLHSSIYYKFNVGDFHFQTDLAMKSRRDKALISTFM